MILASLSGAMFASGGLDQGEIVVVLCPEHIGHIKSALFEFATRKTSEWVGAGVLSADDGREEPEALRPVARSPDSITVIVAGGPAGAIIGLIAIFLPWLAPGFEGEQIPGDPVDYVVSHNLILVATLVVLGVVIVLVGLFYLGWRFHSFRITDDDVEVRSGVVFRSHRRAPLDRVQGVNLTRPTMKSLSCGASLRRNRSARPSRSQR